MKIEIKPDLTGSILDIGGGGEAVIGRVFGMQVTAIDNCQEELDEAPDCCTKQLMDATKLLYPDQFFDNVTFFYSLMYMTHDTREKALREAARVLKPGGILCIWDTCFSSPYPNPYLVDLDIVSDRLSLHTTYGVITDEAQSFGEIAQLLEAAGLRIEHSRTADHHFCIRCAK